MIWHKPHQINFEAKKDKDNLTEPVADQNVKNNAVPPALVEIW